MEDEKFMSATKSLQKSAWISGFLYCYLLVAEEKITKEQILSNQTAPATLASEQFDEFIKLTKMYE